MRRPTLLVAALLLLLTSGPAQAGILDFSVGPKVGFSRTSDSEENTYLVGGAARLGILPSLSAELGLDWRKEDLDNADVTTVPVQLSALVYLLPSLHLTAGIGWYAVDAEFDAIVGEIEAFDDSASDAGIHLGAGLDLPLNESVNLTGDLRYVFLGYELESADQTLEVDADFFTVSAGLQFRLF